jgi:beta-lactamase class D
MKYLFVIFILLSTFSFSQKIEERADLKKFFDEYGHKGCFVLYDLKGDTYLKYNPERCKERFIPASTFKIFNSLVGLETGTVTDEFEIFKWDSVKRSYSNWNQDLNLENAFKYSAVWFYQKLARKIGQEKMQYFINKNRYGNENISGGIDMFWLNGGLRISSDEQIELLKKLYSDSLEFYQRSMDIVKKIMVYDKAENYTISAKTGWALRVEDQIGWFIGYVETKDNVYFFVTNLQTKNPDKGFLSRIQISYNILKYLKII